MEFRRWLENVVIGSIKPVVPQFSWPDMSKMSLVDDDNGWFFYIGTYNVGDRQFILKLTKHRSDPTVIHVDGLNSSGGVDQGSLQQLLPKLTADAQKMGVSKVAWSPATNIFGRTSSIKKNRTPEQEAAIRDRLFNRLAQQSGLPRHQNESSINDLYNSAVAAFPKTTLRQHAVDPIKIAELSIVPFKGMKTIYFKGLAQNENRAYNPIILFKTVQYDSQSPNTIRIVADDGSVYVLDKLSPAANEVAVRCNCADFRWRFNYYDFLDHSLYGRKRAKYEGNYRINPKEMPGMCKHLMSLTRALTDSGILIK
jgi:hypothetical protein